VAEVVRDYGLLQREEAPQDSRSCHGTTPAGSTAR
jgi:hypothetical protein